MTFIRLFLISVVAVASTLAVKAQTHYKSHISVGAHGGGAISRMSFSPEVPQAWQPGPLVGVHVRYAEERIVGLMAELNFVNRGWKESFEDNPDLKYSRTLSYITLPVMTHINFGSPRFKCFFNLGPEFALMLSNSISSNFDYTNPGKLLPATRRVNQMKMDIANKFDYGITAGLGAEYYINPRNSIFIEGRFYYGLGNIFKATKADEFSASRTMTIAVTAGYNFRIK